MKYTLLAVFLTFGAAFHFSNAAAFGFGDDPANTNSTVSSGISMGPGGEDELNTVVFYPNPVKDNLNIRFPHKGNYTVTIYNIIGDKIMEKSIVDTNEMKIDLSALRNGLFFLSYEYEGKIVTKRFSKTN